MPHQQQQHDYKHSFGRERARENVREASRSMLCRHQRRRRCRRQPPLVWLTLINRFYSISSDAAAVSKMQLSQAAFPHYQPLSLTLSLALSVCVRACVYVCVSFYICCCRLFRAKTELHFDCALLIPHQCWRLAAQFNEFALSLSLSLPVKLRSRNLITITIAGSLLTSLWPIKSKYTQQPLLLFMAYALTQINKKKSSASV